MEPHALSEIVQSVINAGLTLTALREPGSSSGRTRAPGGGPDGKFRLAERQPTAYR